VNRHTPAPDEQALLQQQLQRLRADQERLFAQLRDGEQHFRTLARSVWRVQEDERRRLARDLHDGIGQHMTALRHRLEALSLATPASDDLQLALELCVRALEETRALSRLLRPQILDDLGLAAALRWLARSTAEQCGFELELDLAALPATLSPDLATLIFRVAQEALTNIARHAHARNVVLRAAVRNERLTLMVVDDGVGCDVAAAGARGSEGLSTGLASMRERVQLFGGQFQLVSAPGEGTQVRAVVRCGREDEAR
jgi:signal transduction histidine kinase